MTTTIPTVRYLDPVTRPRRRPASPVAPPPVPDHVPAGVAAEHADAASVVSARRRPVGGVRVVSRGQREGSPAGTVLAFVACAAVAALTVPANG